MDCVFRGEGEEVFPQWLTCWNHPEQWHTVPGLCYLTPNKEYKDNGIARVLNFAGLVPPEQSRFFNWSKPFVQLETTRGCFNTCAFCVSGGENRYAPFPSKASAKGYNSSMHMASKCTRIRPLLLITTLEEPKNYSGSFWNSIPISASIWKYIPPCCQKS